jgi:acetoin utilization deacetylase AcuC-like enzyme
MRAVLDYLPERDIWHQLTQYEAPLVDREKLYRVHDKRCVDTVIVAEPSEGRTYLDPDTSMAPHSRNGFSPR